MKSPIFQWFRTVPCVLVTYTDDEIKLLYAIDPYGVADYIQRYASDLDGGLEKTVEYKDEKFRLLFNREPKYFARTIEGVWYEVDDYEEINDVLSESEAYFGMHPIYDLHTFFEILGDCSSILNIVFSTSLFSSGIMKVVKYIAEVSLIAASGYEAILRNEISQYTVNTGIDHII